VWSALQSPVSSIPALASLRLCLVRSLVSGMLRCVSSACTRRVLTLKRVGSQCFTYHCLHDPLPCRHELYHGYKGHRTPMPDEIRETLPRLYDLVSARPGRTYTFWAAVFIDFYSDVVSLAMHPPATATVFQQRSGRHI